MAPDGGTANLVQPGYSYGPCVGINRNFVKPPSCTAVRVRRSGWFNEPGSKKRVEFEFEANYADSKTEDVQYYVSFSYGMLLKEVLE